jgi:hypothetical protein
VEAIHLLTLTPATVRQSSPVSQTTLFVAGALSTDANTTPPTATLLSGAILRRAKRCRRPHRLNSATEQSICQGAKTARLSGDSPTQPLRDSRLRGPWFVSGRSWRVQGGVVESARMVIGGGNGTCHPAVWPIGYTAGPQPVGPLYNRRSERSVTSGASDEQDKSDEPAVRIVIRGHLSRCIPPAAIAVRDHGRTWHGRYGRR